MKRAFRYVVLCAVILLGLQPTIAVAEDPNRAVLIIAHGDGHLTTYCIPFGEAEISGAEVLRRSGLSVRFTAYLGFGAGVCAIDNERCPLEHEDCFCQCKGTPCLYWSYWHWRDGRWLYSQVGASSYKVHDGDIEGWIWGDGQSPPPLVPFEQVCVPTETPIPTDTRAPTPLPTDTPLPAPSPSTTPVPSNTPQPPPADMPSPTARPEPSGTSMPSPRDTRAPTAQATVTQARSATPISVEDTQTIATVTETALATRPTTTARPLVSPTATLGPTSHAKPLVRTPTRAVTELTASVKTTPEPSVTAPPVPTATATCDPSPTQDAPLAQYAAFATMATILVAGFLLLHRRSRR